MVQIAGGEQKADALADYDEAYADSIEKQNKANYENATKQRNGVHIPFIIDGNKKKSVHRSQRGNRYMWLHNV